MSSIRDVARRAGVSPATVSRVLNSDPTVSEETRRIALAAISELSYKKAGSDFIDGNFAFLSTGQFALDSAFETALLFGIKSALVETGGGLLIMETRRSRKAGESFTALCQRKRIRGLLIRTAADSREIVEEIAHEGLPAIVIGDRLANPNVSFVYSNSKDSSQAAVEHLIGLGHRRIAICVNVIDDSDHADRIAGYEQALKQAGIAPERRFFMRIPATRAGGSQVIRRIMTMVNRPTAVFITDPLTAVTAMRHAQDTGIRIPQDLSLVGFDDTEVRLDTFPAMSAICQDTARLGREAFRSLQLLIQQHSRGKTIRLALPTLFDLQGSTAPPKPGL